jgi:hypothetical protein
MLKKPTYEELEQRVKELEKEVQERMAKSQMLIYGANDEFVATYAIFKKLQCQNDKCLGYLILNGALIAS